MDAQEVGESFARVGLAKSKKDSRGHRNSWLAQDASGLFGHGGKIGKHGSRRHGNTADYWTLETKRWALASGCRESAGSGFNDVVADGVTHQLADRMTVETAHDVGAVRFSCFHTQAKSHGDFLAALALGKKLYDLALTGS